LLALLASSARSADSALESVAAASRAWDEAYASGDAARLAERYDDRAVSMPPGLPALASRSVIEADFKAFFESNTATIGRLMPTDRSPATSQSSAHDMKRRFVQETEVQLSARQASMSSCTGARQMGAGRSSGRYGTAISSRDLNDRFDVPVRPDGQGAAAVPGGPTSSCERPR
jgi:hypothetical protein